MRAAVPAVVLLVALACGRPAASPSDAVEPGAAPTGWTASECTDPPTACGAIRIELPWLRPSANDPTWAVEHLSNDADADEALRIIAETRDAKAIAATRALASKPSRARRLALFVLGVVHDVDAVPALVGALQDDDAAVRAMAAWSLGRLGSSTAEVDAALWKSAVDDEAFSVRCTAAETLGRLRGRRVDPVWRLAPDELYAIGTPLPDGVAAHVGRRFCTEIVFEDDDLVLVGINKGEFGGGVAYVPRARTDAAPTAIDGAPADPLQFVRVAGEPWLISGLAHLSLSGAAVHRIRREASGQLVAERIVSLRHIPIWYKVEDTTLILKTDDGRIHRIQAAY